MKVPGDGLRADGITCRDLTLHLFSFTGLRSAFQSWGDPLMTVGREKGGFNENTAMRHRRSG